MRFLIIAIILATSCVNTTSNKLNSTKWQLISMTNNRLNNIDDNEKIWIEAFGNDTSKNKVYIDFDTDSTVFLFINSDVPMNKSGTKYRRLIDTLILEDKSENRKDTILIQTHTNDSLILHNLHGTEYVLKRIGGKKE